MSKIQGLLTNSLIGAGIGGVVGAVYFVFQSLQPNSNSSNQSNDPSNLLSKYNKITYYNNLHDLLKRMMPYVTFAPQEMDNICNYFQRLIDIQINIQNKQIKPSLPYEATRLGSSIQYTLAQLKQKGRNIAMPHFEEESKALVQIADDFAYNIRQDVNYFYTTNKL